MYEYLNTSNGRWVQVTEKHIVASVTTILNVIHKPFLTEWKLKQGYKADLELQKAVQLGNVTHDILERLVNGEDIDWTDENHYHIRNKKVNINRKMLKAIISFVEWWNNGVPKKMVQTEVNLYNEKRSWCGTADLVCDIYNEKKEIWERWLIDYKTSNQLSEQVDLQLTAYAMLYNDFNPDEPVVRIGALQCKKGWIKATTCQAKLKEFKIATDIWESIVNVYYHYHPKPRMKSELTRVFKLKEYE
tara:strand:- start:2872 stop:3609 length:738 start_codon:yes stop_codon:yes gene_type:complete